MRLPNDNSIQKAVPDKYMTEPPFDDLKELFFLFPVEFRIKRIEIFTVELIRCQSERLAEAYRIMQTTISA